MKSSAKTSKLIVEIPETTHKKLKAMAALRGKSIKDIFLEAIPYIEESNLCALTPHIPNEETAQGLRETINRKDIFSAENVFEILKHSEND